MRAYAEQKRDLALQLIEEARAHLKKYPASCSARIRREDARPPNLTR